ncbi:MAG TPA: DUF438 domain-containing protein [Bacteroidia bacterium]|nr:DUF438 domain-containing protein [Sphingobacteriales bacterium]HPD65244.1 DUF438 domain-containing protein [Bacteroidia bacterium]HRS58623.1 DUF438 domain-containing protein [Bacteroidia bacterium]HRU67830.1 DUF438 domain-containing protein [Bacteroidia bacterium]
MSELINNSEKKKELLKHMILQLHKGEAPEMVRKRMIELMSSIPYDDVVEVEQELISEGLPIEEVLRLCDIHTQVLEGHIDQSAAKEIPEGHPADVFKKENRELEKVVAKLNEEYIMLSGLNSEDEIPAYLMKIRDLFNQLMDVEKHYLRKENLLFPFLEKHGITGPPKVMWGKHNETRELLKAAIESLSVNEKLSFEDISGMIQMVLIPASKSITDMIMKEEEILLPMCMDTLSESEWYEIHRQTMTIGYCLYVPDKEWIPEGIQENGEEIHEAGHINLPTGILAVDELIGIFSKLPVDITFVDKNDKVKFFSEGDRIFHRSKAIINRDVRMCHPPHSVHVVEQILNDFKSGKASKAPFWINMKGRFILIEYFAVRNEKGEYLGTLEVTQDLTNARKLEGEQRLLSYAN